MKAPYGHRSVALWWAVLLGSAGVTWLPFPIAYTGFAGLGLCAAAVVYVCGRLLWEIIQVTGS